MFKITKQHIGKIVFCVPTGNNVSRYGDRNPLSQMEELTVKQVSRKNILLGDQTVKFMEYDREFPEYNTKYNSGWVVFETLEDFKDYKDYLDNIALIKEYIGTYGRFKFSKIKTRMIADILRDDSID